MSSEDQFTEDIRVRVPKGIRDALQRLGKKQLKKESELVREALLDYLTRNRETIPGIAGSSLDTHDQLNTRIRQKEGEPDRVANDAGKMVVSEFPAPPQPSASEPQAAEEKPDRTDRRLSDKLKHDVARMTREKRGK